MPCYAIVSLELEPSVVGYVFSDDEDAAVDAWGSGDDVVIVAVAAAHSGALPSDVRIDRTN